MHRLVNIPHEKDRRLDIEHTVATNAVSVVVFGVETDARKTMKLIGTENGELNEGSAACVALLEQVLADAKAGKITTVGIIACGLDDFGANIAGADARAIYMGCGVLQDRIIQVVTGKQTVPSAILRPQGGNGFRQPRPVGPRR